MDERFLRNPHRPKLASAEYPLDSFMRDWWAQTSGNPFSNRERIWNDAIAVECSPFDGKIHLSAIRTFEAGKGQASAALEALKALADKYGVSIDLDAKPFGNKGLRKAQLVAWYKRHGFQPKDGSLVYTPPVSNEPPPTKGKLKLDLSKPMVGIPAEEEGSSGVSKKKPLKLRIAGGDDVTVGTVSTAPNFRAWFSGSKVVDASGQPLLLFHGSPDISFEEFREGSFFTEDKAYAKVYTDPYASASEVVKERADPGVVAVYLKIKRPFDTRQAKAQQDYHQKFLPFVPSDERYQLAPDTLADWGQATALLRWIRETKQPYDGLILSEGPGHAPVWVPCSPKQVWVAEKEHLDPEDDTDYYEEYHASRT